MRNTICNEETFVASQSYCDNFLRNYRHLRVANIVSTTVGQIKPNRTEWTLFQEFNEVFRFHATFFTSERLAVDLTYHILNAPSGGV